MSKSKVANFIEAIQTIAQDISADYKAYEQLRSLKTSVHMIKARLSNLEASFDEARAIHQKIVEAPSEEQKCSYMEALTFHKLKELFFQYSCELKEQLPSVEDQPVSKSSVPSVDLKLPPMKLPTFDGSLQLWPEFKGLFEGLINSNTSISDAHKLHYLKGSLTGEAARLLRNTDNNFDSAWAILVKRYQNIRLLKDNQFKLLFNHPRVHDESANDLKALLDTANEARHSLKNLGVLVDSWQDVLVFHMVQKLPTITRGQWEAHISNHPDYPNFNTLEDFILMRARTLEVVGQPISTLSQSKARKGSLGAIQVHNLSTSKCSMCQGSHSVSHCFKFKALNVRKRLELVKTKKLCFNCLSNTHFTQNCTSNFTCSTCQQKHHSLLHTTEQANAMHVQARAHIGAGSSPVQTIPSTLHPSQQGTSGTSPYYNGTTAAYNTTIAETARVLLATALIKVFSVEGHPILLRALIDPGSEASFISESAVHLLRPQRERSSVRILGVGESRVSTSKHRVSLTLMSNVNEKFRLNLKAWVLPKLTAMLPRYSMPHADWNHIQNLKLADPLYNQPGKIDVLLGSDCYPDIIVNGLIKGEPGTPMAQRTELGWVLSGKISSLPHSQITSLHMTIEDQGLEKMHQNFGELEEVQGVRSLFAEEETCETHFIQTHRRQDDGRYIVKLPFKEGARPILGPSQRSAFQRCLQLERRFERRPSFYNEHQGVVEDYKTLKHMTEIDPSTLTNAHYYIPHHAVMKESSSTTKLRINDHLCIGPRLQDDIVNHIARCRKHKIALAADIAKMYRQIWVSAEDATYQLILWRDVEGGDIKTYRLNTVTFGTSSAPYLAVRTLQQLATDEQRNYPLPSDIARKNFYVDDFIHGADSEEEAIQTQSQLTQLMKRGGFLLWKWVSNSAKLLEFIPIEEREVKLPLSFDKGNTVKTLGIQWHPASDNLTSKIALRDLAKTTKRTLLSDIARLHDPMGWISPCIILGKIRMLPQRLVGYKQWWQGPAFLETFDCQQQPEQKIGATDLELRTSKPSRAKGDVITPGYPSRHPFQLCVHVATTEVDKLLGHFSSFRKLLRATAYWLRFFSNLRDKAKGNPIQLTGPLSPNEITSARMRLISIIQHEFFAEEILSHQIVSKKGKLARLSPIIDKTGLLRVGGRLENANLSYAQRHLIILTSHNILTSLRILDTHLKTLHGGQQLMMITLRSEYWVLQPNENVKVGQMVLLPDETPLTLWRLGKITEVHSGADGKIRVVTVRTANASIKRPITKLCLLPTSE